MIKGKQQREGYGNTEVELKKQSKTKRRKNQKMEVKEKWICPDAEVQRFTPQEYVAMCYVYTYSCIGDDKGIYLCDSKGKTTGHTVQHEAHQITISTKTQGQPVTLTYGGIKQDNNQGQGSAQTHGYYFQYSNQYHFGTASSFTLTSTNNVS